MNEVRWLAPAYYSRFTCKADRCRHTCCSGWRIPVSRREYERLITMDRTPELDRRIQNAFVVPKTVSDSCYRYIAFNWEGVCPIMKDGLCSLYQEKGEEFQSRVCRLYPRSLKNINGVNVASCSSSCERVVEMLYGHDCMNIEEISLDEKAELTYEVSEDDIEQIKEFEELIRDETTTLAQSIADICRIINKEEFDRDFDEDTDSVRNGIELLERFSTSNPILEQIISDISIRYRDGDVFCRDREEFEKKYPDWMKFFERLINNSMLYECFPFVDKRADRTKVYKGLCCCYGLLRLVCIGATHDSDDVDDLVDAAAALFHLIDHTAFYYNASIIVDNAAAMLRI